jgi:branched-chain amino acid aminotransferase
MRVWIGSGASGELVPTESAQISAFDHGFTVGDGIFETMKAVNGRLFLWPWHLERLRASAAAMRIELPNQAHLTNIVRRVANESAVELSGQARVRLTISAGLGPLGSARLDMPPTIVCAASAMPVRSGDARLHVASWPRNERSPLSGVKSTSYADNVLALAEASARGAGEAIFFNTRSELCEGTGSNVFLVCDGVALTPPTSAGLLAGVTRRFVLSLGEAADRVVERSLSIEHLAAADEVFITSTFQDVRGVSDIDGRRLEIGPVTRALQLRFAAAASAEWCWT